MVYVLISHEIEDFSKWKTVFDADSEARKTGGETGQSMVFQAADNSNKITMLFEWESAEKLDEFMNSDLLKEKMKEAGVKSEPTVAILNKV